MTENDNYNRKDLIKMVSSIFGEEMTESELEKRAELWQLADNTDDADILSKLAKCPYVEVREGVAANVNTSVNTLIELSEDEDFEVRQTVALNSNTPQSVLDKLKNDENEFVREVFKRRC